MTLVFAFLRIAVDDAISPIFLYHEISIWFENGGAKGPFVSFRISFLSF